MEDFRKSPHFNAAERAALAYAEEMTKTPVDVADAVFAELRRHFDEDAIVELTAMIALENFRARMSHALDIPSDNLATHERSHGEARGAERTSVCERAEAGTDDDCA